MSLSHLTTRAATNDSSQEVTKLDFVYDFELTDEQRSQLRKLVDNYRTDVLHKNPALKELPMPFGCKAMPGFEERIICIKIGGMIVGFVGYNVEGKVLNETRLFVDIAFRGKGYAIALLNQLLIVARKNSLRAIYFYNLTKDGGAAVKKFEEFIKQSNDFHLRFFYRENVVTIVLEDEIGCASFEEHHKILPCFFPYEQDVMVFDAKDNYIFTNYGRLLDMNSGYWCSPFGYRQPDLEKVMTEGYFSHLFGYLHPPAISLAQKLCEITGMARVAFNTSGSSVVDAAIRLAWQYAKTRYGALERKVIVSLKGGFYGSATTGLEAAGLKTVGGDYKYYLPDHEVDKKIDPLGECFNPLEELIEREGLQRKIAAFIFEPVLGVRGAYALDKERLKAMIDTCKKYDIVTIADEISTGIGRTGELYACKHYGISPDMICFGKPLTNGMFPLAALLFNDKINSIFLENQHLKRNDFLYGSTLGGHPTGCMIALRIIDLLQKGTTLQRVRQHSELMLNTLKDFQKKFSVIREIHGIGLMLGIELKKSTIAKTIQSELRKYWINCIPEGRTLMLMPPYTITDEQIAHFLITLERIMSEATARFESGQ